MPRIDDSPEAIRSGKPELRSPPKDLRVAGLYQAITVLVMFMQNNIVKTGGAGPRQGNAHKDMVDGVIQQLKKASNWNVLESLEQLLMNIELVHKIKAIQREMHKSLAEVLDPVISEDVREEFLSTLLNIVIATSCILVHQCKGQLQNLNMNAMIDDEISMMIAALLNILCEEISAEDPLYKKWNIVFKQFQMKFTKVFSAIERETASVRGRLPMDHASFEKLLLPLMGVDSTALYGIFDAYKDTPKLELHIDILILAFAAAFSLKLLYYLLKYKFLEKAELFAIPGVAITVVGFLTVAGSMCSAPFRWIFIFKAILILVALLLKTKEEGHFFKLTDEWRKRVAGGDD